MKCPACEYTTDDSDELINHLSFCKAKPLNKWETFAEYGLQPLNCKTSQIYDVIQEEENER